MTMSTFKAVTLSFLFLLSVIIAMTLFSLSLPVFGQTTKAPPAVTPTPVPTPTPTSPNPNLQYLPQKAYVQAYAPENGIPSGQQPLQVVPTVVPQPTAVASQSNILDSFGGITGITGLAAAAYAAIKSNLLGKTTQAIAQNQVKIAEVQQEHLDLTFDQMPQKGNEIVNKPLIKQDHVQAIKDEVIKTAAKA